MPAAMGSCPRGMPVGCMVLPDQPANAVVVTLEVIKLVIFIGNSLFTPPPLLFPSLRIQSTKLTSVPKPPR